MALPTDEPGIGDGGDTGTPGGGGGGGVGNIGTAVFEVPFTKQQDESILKVLVYASLASPDDLQLIAYVTIGGVVRQVTPINLIFDSLNSRAQDAKTIPTFVTGLPAGQHDVIFSIRNQEPDGALTVKAGAYIEITEIKRAAL